MLPLSITYEMPDPVASAATRENWLDFARRLFSPGTVALVGLSGLILVLSVRSRGPLPWLVLSGTAPSLYALLVIVWTGGLWWGPWAARRRLSHLPHRRVIVELTETTLSFQTATERLEVRWSELQSVKPLPNFWVLRVKSGAEIPVPRHAVSEEVLAALRQWAPGAFPRHGKS